MARSDLPRLRLLLDASFCLALIRTHSTRLSALFAEYIPGEVGISAVTVAALQRRVLGSSNPARNRAALEQFLLPLEVVDFDTAAAVALAALEIHAGVGAAPSAEALMIAAQAAVLEATVATCLPRLYGPLPAPVSYTHLTLPTNREV